MYFRNILKLNIFSKVFIKLIIVLSCVVVYVYTMNGLLFISYRYVTVA